MSEKDKSGTKLVTCSRGAKNRLACSHERVLVLQLQCTAEHDTDLAVLLQDVNL